MRHVIYRSAGSNEMRDIAPAIVLGSALWLLVLAGAALNETGQSDDRQAAAAHQAKWPERYSKHALDKRRNGPLTALSAGHGSGQASPPDGESGVDEMLVFRASD